MAIKMYENKVTHEEYMVMSKNTFQIIQLGSILGIFLFLNGLFFQMPYLLVSGATFMVLASWATFANLQKQQVQEKEQGKYKEVV